MLNIDRRKAERTFLWVFENSLILGAPFALVGFVFGVILLDPMMIAQSIGGLFVFALAFTLFIWGFGVVSDLVFLILKFSVAQLFRYGARFIRSVVRDCQNYQGWRNRGQGSSLF
ncbi:MAG: hypothetical protein AB7S74_09840 [Hyphomicrobium sp.]